MNHIIKRSLSTVKQGFQNYLNYSYFDFQYLKWYFKYSHNLKQFKNIHQHESCFIIGNGPSLNKINLSILKDYHTFGLNKIYLMFNKVDINLTYHVAVNRLVIEQSIKEFESLSCPSFLSYKASREIIRPLNHIYFVATRPSITPSFYTNIEQGLNEGYTVTYAAMQIAFYMGFKQVFLIGVDHNFYAPGNPNEKQLLKGDDPNHFSPDYFGNKEWHLPDLEGSEISYNLAKFQFNRNNRQIFDATVDGHLNIFPKLTYEEALAMCNKK
jgi:hypothetical protein